jgi:Holliday junction DNA helicase RuvA
MIGKLKGVIENITSEGVLIDVGGVCFEAVCSARTLSRLGRIGEPAVLFTETYIREDQIRLVGFLDAAERRWFRRLTGVQGVGTRSALALLSVLEPEALMQAVVLQDKSTLTRANGIGPRLAQRILIELKDKVVAETAEEARAVETVGAVGGNGVVQGGAAGDAISALVNLGYGQGEAVQAVAQALREGGVDASAQLLIRLGLKELAR